MRPLPPQRGSVLLSVLIVMMLASVMVVALQHRQSADTQSTMQFVRTVQAWHYALGAESYAKELLYASYDSKTLADYPSQPWGKPIAPFDLPQGSIAMRITDLQSRFNLNSLAQSNAMPLDVFTQLLAQSGVDPKHAATLLQALKGLAAASAPPADSSDDEPPPDEGNACGGTPLFTDPSQLIPLGLTVDDYKKIASAITALPDTCLTININTVSDLLRNIIVSNPTKQSAVAQLKSQQGYLTGSDVAKLGLGDGITADSHYFGVDAAVTDDLGSYGLSSIINRSVGDKGQVIVKTVSRRWQSCPECAS